MKISIFGTGYVGLVTGACLANLGHEILCIDILPEKIAMLEKGEIPFYEPGLKELVLRNKEKNRLKFTFDVQQGVQFADVIFNCVGTPSNLDGSADLQYVYTVAKNVAIYAQENQPKLLINKSTVPPGTAKKCSEIIKEANPLSLIEVVSNPEFLAEGKAVHDFTHPDKIVIGTKSDRAGHFLRKVYQGRIRTYIPILETDWETAEMIKYANNSFLATKISFINEIANICDNVGADVKIVAQAMGMDYRISPKFLNAGIGYGGSCFPKDVRALINTAEKSGYDARLLKQVDQLNERQKAQLLNKISNHFNHDLSGRHFTLWGLSFKPQTSDIREAPSLTIIEELLKRGAKITVFDPIAHEEVHKLIGDKVNYADSIESSVKDSNALIIATEWDEFRNCNLAELGKEMRERVVFDGRNIFEPEMVKEEGFFYYGVGRR